MKTAVVRHLRFLLFCLLSILPFHASCAAWVRLALNDQRYPLVLVIPLLSLAMVYLRRSAIFPTLPSAPTLGPPRLLAGLLPTVAFSRGRSIAVSVLAIVAIWMAVFALFYGARAFRATLRQA